MVSGKGAILAPNPQVNPSQRSIRQGPRDLLFLVKKPGKIRGLVDIMQQGLKMEQRDRKILQLLIHELDQLLVAATGVFSAHWIVKAKSVIYRRAPKRQADLEFNPDWAPDDKESRWIDELIEEHRGTDSDKQH